MYMQKFLIRMAVLFVATGLMLVGMRLVPMPWAVIFPIGFVVLTLYVVRSFTKQVMDGSMFKPKDIPNGVPAAARIVAVAQAGMSMTVNTIQFYKLNIDVQVMGKNGDEWPARLTHMVDLTNLSVLRPGEVINVIYDPENPSHVIPGSNSAVEAFTQGMTADLQQRLRNMEATIAALSASGVPAKAQIREYQLLHPNITPGGDFIHLAVTVLPDHDREFDASFDVAIASASTHKFQPGQNIYVKYDANNPLRLFLTGSDQPNTGRRVAYGEKV